MQYTITYSKLLCLHSHTFVIEANAIMAEFISRRLDLEEFSTLPALVC